MNNPSRTNRSDRYEVGLQPHFAANLPTRHARGRFGKALFMLSTGMGILFLLFLLLNIINQAFGYVVVGSQIDPDELAIGGVSLEAMSNEQLAQVLNENVSSGLLRQLQRERSLTEYSGEELHDLVVQHVVEPEVLKTWTLAQSLLKPGQILAEAAQEFPGGKVVFKSWLTQDFITEPQSSDPLLAGVKTAALGSLWTVAITILAAFPVGVGAAIYLEEYAADNRLNRLIQTNINNLAGVPSIIYGMLGLAIFVRVMEPLTSGAIFGAGDVSTANGRTILSAGLTLALLVLPLIIINAQEAIRAVPASLRQASYGLGATQWQTVWHHVLPYAMSGILTGTILAISRAIGETAPLVVVGAATLITFDPSSPFSQFTTLPIQIYQWTARPQAEFRNLAAAAILTLLTLLLSLNAAAVLLRNHFRKQEGS